jgi:hypothetical protein
VYGNFQRSRQLLVPQDVGQGRKATWKEINGSIDKLMSFRLPTKNEFDKIKFAIWSVFEILLMLLAMVAVIAVAWKHIQ